MRTNPINKKESHIKRQNCHFLVKIFFSLDTEWGHEDPESSCYNSQTFFWTGFYDERVVLDSRKIDLKLE